MCVSARLHIFANVWISVYVRVCVSRQPVN